MAALVANSALVAFLMQAFLVGPVEAGAPAPERPKQRFEINFMKSTIEHHLFGVEMAKLCLDKATPPPPEGDALLRELCTNIIEVQTQEAQQLQQWLLDWYGVDFEPTIAQGQRGRMTRLDGEDFDVAVSEMFIGHHLQQIRRSVQCLLTAGHRELLDLCEGTIRAQSSEIVEFRDVLQQHGEDFRR